MKIIKTHIADLILIDPLVYEDDRGYFFESYNETKYKKSGLNYSFIQDNEAQSVYGVLRGLHFQRPPYTQTKLIRVIKGEIIDVVVDLRKNSRSYGEVYTVVLNDKNKLQLVVPKGFAHGYAVLSEKAIVAYKVDEKYMPEYEDGIVWNDRKLNIDWKIKEEEIILSGKDKSLGKMSEFNTPFV